MKRISLILAFLLVHFVLDGCEYYSIKAKKPTEIDGLVGYWKFEGDAQDSSGNYNHGFWVGEEFYSEEGVFGKAAVFNGTSNYVTIPHSPSIDVGWSAFSVGAWVNSIGHGRYNQHLLNKRTGGKGPFWDMYLSGLVENINAEVAGQSFDNPPSNMSLRKWHYVMLTRDANGLVTVYIDGKPVNSKGMPGDSSNTHSFNIGNLEGSLDQGFNGLVDEVVIYNRALTREEVIGLYKAGG